MKKVFLSFLCSMGLSWGMEAEQADPCNLLSVPFDVFNAHIAPRLTWHAYEAVYWSCKHFNEQLKGEGQVIELEYNAAAPKPPLEKYTYFTQYPMAKGVKFNHLFQSGQFIHKAEESANTLLTPLKSMPNIQELILRDFAVSDNVLNKIVESAPNLQKLVIEDNAIAKAPNLLPLKLGVLLKLPHLKALLFSEMTEGKKLRFDEEQLTSLLLVNNLEELSLASSHLNENIVNILGQLSKLTNLKILLPPAKIREDDQECLDLWYPLYNLPIPTPPNLKKLVVKRMSFNEKSIASLFQLTALEALGLTDNNLSSYNNRSSGIYTQSFNQVVSRLKEFSLLTSLDFSYSYFNSDSMLHLAKLTNLKRLKLDHCTDIQKGQFTPLSGLLSLEALSLIKTHINADDLQTIFKLVSLINLNVEGCKNFTSTDFPSLVKLRNLRILNLRDTRVDDDVIDQLLPILSYLTVLTITSAKYRGVSLDKTEEIKNKYPNLQLNKYY